MNEKTEDNSLLNNHFCYCEMVCKKNIIKNGKNAGSEFYACPRWPSDNKCNYFKIVNDKDGSNFKVEKRRPIERSTYNTNEMLKMTDKAYITPLVSYYSIIKFKKYFMSKHPCTITLSSLFERDTSYIDLWIQDLQNKYISVKVIPLRKHWMRFDADITHLKLMDNDMKDELYCLFADYYKNYSKIENFDQDRWNEENNKYWLCLHGMGRNDIGFLDGNAKYFAFEKNDNTFFTIKRKDIKNITIFEERVETCNNAKFTWFKYDELEPFIKPIKLNNF